MVSKSRKPLGSTKTVGVGGDALALLVREWLQELKMMGRSPRTIGWYQQKSRSSPR